MAELTVLALLFPAIGFLYCALVGWQLPGRLAGYIASGAIGCSFVVAMVVLVGLLGQPVEDRLFDLPLWTWIASGDVSVRFGLLVDPLSALMLLIVTGVGFAIHIYSIGYMRDDPGYVRFFAYMNLFVLAMLVLVLADNFLMLMVGWAGVGLCSYLLIAFWFERPEAAHAGVKAFVINSIGDVGLLLASLLILTTFGTLDYQSVFQAAPRTLESGGGTATAIALLLLLAAIAKSAQLPLYTWLPDAMAGPTPVSALIHAATMVAAGVYLIARAHPIFELSTQAMAVTAVIGGVTAIFAASIGIAKTNIKRVLAYSTISQLGYMFLGVGVGGFAAGMFHLTTHALFKALLFLAAGGVIHALAGEEDLRKMGGLRRHLPVVYWTFLVGALALAGFPLLSGFFSKDEILYAAFTSPQGNFFLGLLALIAVTFTAFYAFRVFFMAFHGNPQIGATAGRQPASAANHLHRPGKAMTIPIVVLAALAAVAGYVQFPGQGLDSFLSPVFAADPSLGAGVGATEGSASVVLDGNYALIASLSTLAALVGFGLAFLLYGRETALPRRLAFLLGSLRQLLINDYYVESFFDALIVRPLRALANVLATAVDGGLVDGAVNGIGAITLRLGSVLSRLQTGYARVYALGILAGAVLVLAYLARLGATR